MIKEFDIVKDSNDKVYLFTGFCKMKDISSGKWVDGCTYMEWDILVDNTVGDMYVMEKESFEKEFKIYEKV